MRMRNGDGMCVATKWLEQVIISQIIISINAEVLQRLVSGAVSTALYPAGAIFGTLKPALLFLVRLNLPPLP